MKKNPESKQITPQFRFEYVTNTASLFVAANQGDGIVVQVVNDGGVSENTSPQGPEPQDAGVPRGVA